NASEITLPSRAIDGAANDRGGPGSVVMSPPSWPWPGAPESPKNGTPASPPWYEPPTSCAVVDVPPGTPTVSPLPPAPPVPTTQLWPGSFGPASAMPPLPPRNDECDTNTP